MNRIIAAAVAVVFLWCALPARADTAGSVRGIVTFANAPRADASVTLEGEGSRYTATTRSDGSFNFPQVPFGHYHVTIHSLGAADRTIDVDVSSDSVARVDVALTTLKEIANTIVTAHAGVGGTPVSVNDITKAQIQTSPNRDSLDRLIETVPGIVRFSYNEPVAHGFHGLTYEIDGAPLPQATTSNFAEIIDPKSIDSLEISTGAMPAEYGGSRQGAVVNIVSSRLSDVAPGNYGRFTFGGGEYASTLGSFNDMARFGKTEISLDLNTQRTDRGIDTPTFVPIHDNSSQTDGFLRAITQVDKQSTLALDLSSQFSQFEIPINTDPNNPDDPIYSLPGTDDVQREYDRFVNLNYTRASKDGESVFQLIPWIRSTRVAYDGDLANDVATISQIGLKQDRFATYAGIRTSELHTSAHHNVKVGLDLSRENFNGSQTFACYTPDCNLAPSTPPPAPPSPGYYPFNSTQNQTGAQVGLYAQDKWQPSSNLAIDYGLRYDHSSGYVGGWQISPRIGFNLSDGGKNILHAYYGRFYAAPQLEDERQDCVILNGCSGTPVYDLQPERDAYYEFGVAHTFNSHMKGYANLFSKSTSNVLDTTQFLNTPLFAVYNNATGIDTGVEFRLEDAEHNGDAWFLSGTISGSYAGGISGSTFLFPTNINEGLPPTSPALLSPEDHDQTVAATSGYTHRFGADKGWYGSLQANYGTGYPVAFQNATVNLSGRLPTHLTFDLGMGKNLAANAKNGLGVALDIDNMLNHQYIIKIANGFNTTQIATGRRILFRVTAPF
ncbi:MAG: TonB-dependent receptor [Candidatus Eremiobacteraeota bacterium]|nr:TonB-dependent receptor [Candidatus Eremiobacteraeota bacterium]